LFQLFKSSTASGPPPLSRRTNLVMFLEMMTWQIDILRAEFGERMVFSEVKTFHFNIRIVQATLWR